MILPVISAAALIAASSPTPSNQARTAGPGYLTPPKGWTKMELPPNAPVDFDWLSPRYHGTGENIAVVVGALPDAATLDSVVRDAIAQVHEQGRSIASSRSHATCHGAQTGWTLDVRIAVAPHRFVSQIQQFAVHNNKVYTIMYTHTAGAPIDKAVRDSIDSLCPAGS